MSAAGGAAPTEGLPPPWAVIGVILVVGAVLAVWVEVASRRQLRKMDALWAAARRHQLREHEALMARLTERVAAPRVLPRRVVKMDDAITVELEVIKPQQLRGEWKGESGDG